MTGGMFYLQILPIEKGNSAIVCNSLVHHRHANIYKDIFAYWTS